MTYIRFGNSICPYGADTIYSGVVAVSVHDQGAAADLLCLSPDPQYLKYQNGYQGYAKAFGAEYKLPDGSLVDQNHDHNVP